MPITGVYFIPATTSTTPSAMEHITQRLKSTFKEADLIPIGRWVMEQKIMRDTPGLLPHTNPNEKPPKPRWMQFLSLSHYKNHGFIYTSEPLEKPFHPPNAASPVPSAMPATNAGDTLPMIMATMSHSACKTMFQHFSYACQPFWAHRLTLTVPNGVYYDVGDFRVRVGDVRQTFPSLRARGTLVEIEWRGPSMIDSFTATVASNGENSDSGVDVSFSALEDADVDAEYAATALLIREFWQRLGVEGAKEAILVPGVGSEVKEQLAKVKSGKHVFDKRAQRGDAILKKLGLSDSTEQDPDPQAGVDVARQYMEVLRFNR
ncbi:Mediator complex subunit Med20 [Penicillium argentinense]|uniref:Mediator of RNA polymerase II transcription subunit 20 n=1 Tax=Penicillium argentinense TaxID=1131581 RepID=A0A9W9EYA4_9EURO|nr:Mediator complex subunit Med20 [Penicillium argentinense]KAJ5090214.1 Mediator complex subunit Med20 [Penicillium argentinense]